MDIRKEETDDAHPPSNMDSHARGVPTPSGVFKQWSTKYPDTMDVVRIIRGTGLRRRYINL
jgi:hypothetical protein